MQFSINLKCVTVKLNTNGGKLEQVDEVLHFVIIIKNGTISGEILRHVNTFK